jgi:hypothetical protein
LALTTGRTPRSAQPGCDRRSIVKLIRRRPVSVDRSAKLIVETDYVSMNRFQPFGRLVRARRDAPASAALDGKRLGLAMKLPFLATQNAGESWQRRAVGWKKGQYPVSEGRLARVRPDGLAFGSPAAILDDLNSGGAAAMLKDDDLLPITCPNCGHQFDEEMGTLKSGSPVVCLRCTNQLEYDRHAALELINDTPGALDNFHRSVRKKE